jgi:hypothetical protein
LVRNVSPAANEPIRNVALIARNDPAITAALAGADGNSSGIHVLLVALPDLASRRPFAPI